MDTYTHLSTKQLSELLPYGERTIRNRLKDSVWLEGVHSLSAWDQILPDAMMTVAAIDRLIHHGSIIELTGDSYRKQKRMERSTE